MRRILCLWLPRWPIQRLLAARPELRARAVALFTRQPRQGERVMACCEAAEQRGIRVGMPVSEAAALAAAAALHCQPHEPQADRLALGQIARVCDRFSPLVGMNMGFDAGDEPDGLLLDITGLGPLFGGEASLAAGVARMCEQHGYQSRIAVADTIGAAWAIAHHGTTCDVEHSTLDVGRSTLDVRLPHRDNSEDGSENNSAQNCVAIVPSGQTVAALALLPAAALRLPAETVELLHSLGIVRVAQLLNLPREDLRSRFGQELIWRLDQATGGMAEVIVAQHSLPEPAASWPLEYPTAHAETLRHVLGILLRRVAEQLAARQQGVLELTCRLDCGGQGIDLRVGLFQPTAIAEHLQELLGMQVERLRLPEAVSQAAVTATRIAPLIERQQELFANEPRERQRQLAVLVDRLSSRLGPEQVVRPRLQAEAQPEAAVAYEPLTKLGALRSARGSPGSRGARGSRARSSRASQPASHRARSSEDEDFTRPPLAPRPLRLFSLPLPIEVLATTPVGLPSLIRPAGQSKQTPSPPWGEGWGEGQIWGPERIETAWWRGRTIRRDYYRVETAAGARLWIFRRLSDNAWFLHGEFD